MKFFTALSSFFATIAGVKAGLSIDSPACTKVPSQGGAVVKDPTKCVETYNDPNSQLAAPSCEDTQPGTFCWKMNEALFGYPKYGGEVTGTLYYNYLEEDQRDACDPIAKVPGSDENGKGAILVVDRGGGCTFVQKVRNAEVAGFKAVLVLDNQDTKKRVFMADDGTGSSISIPSVFVDFNQGKRIKEGLANYGDGFIRITLRWTLPESQGGVTWSLWTSADDAEARHFKENFQQIFDRLGPTQDFTPHFFITNGYTGGCIKPRGPKSAMTLNLCGAQCVYDGLYCAEDPERDLTLGIDGSDVVYENLRQICIFRTAKSNDPNNKNMGQVKFFDYLDLFAKNCKDKDETHSRACSEKQMQAAKFTQKQIESVRSCAGTCDDDGKPDGCIQPADDYVDIDGFRKNALLEQELNDQKNDGIFTIPTIVINGRHYRGGYTCPFPPNRGTCGAFNAICEAYVDNEEPLACKDTFCWGEDCPGGCQGGFDCIGKCNGFAQNDECGVCGGDGSKCLENSDCNPDCKGVCGGSATADSCGVCGGDGSKCALNYAVQSVKRGGAVAGIVITVVVVLVLAIVAVVVVMVVCLHKKDQDTRRYVDSVVSSYLPMEDENEEGDVEVETTETLVVDEQATATL